ncbi:endonuclease V [Stackebrandtia endophytica]|uniref:Endonuclease V n=1 Tax=Stackebrandtia endophytica TaxID=1496996 RepID=A0A543AQ49_9ACTN|nr:endonuclease V [Stackebrandtia endophytica]TQL74666.1 endonuclease V [Stackebrandtia endophytica]
MTDLSVDDAIRLQEAWRDRVRIPTERLDPDTATGVDIGYDSASDRLVAVAATIDLATLTVTEVAVAVGTADFPYVPGLLGFREVPMFEIVVGKLRDRPQLLVCDGHGLAHPRRFGSACHLGVATGIPAIGVAKNPPQYSVPDPADQRGSRTGVYDGTDHIGYSLRTRTSVKPVYVSVGHDIGLDEAVDIVLRLTPEYRLPETTRQADRLGRRLLAEMSGDSALSVPSERLASQPGAISEPT